MERTNWASSAWNSTLDWNDVPSAWLYRQDHLWATQDLRTSYVHHDRHIDTCGHLWSAPIGHHRPGILPLTGMMSLQPGCTVRTTCGQLRTSGPRMFTLGAWLYGQDHLWATQDLRTSYVHHDRHIDTCGHLWSAPIGHFRPEILPLTGMMSLQPGCTVRTTCGQLRTSGPRMFTLGAWLYGQDHLWATQDLRTSYVHHDRHIDTCGHLWSAPIGHYRPGILPLTGMMSLQPGCTVRTTCGQLRTSGPRMFTMTDTLTPVDTCGAHQLGIIGLEFYP